MRARHDQELGRMAEMRVPSDDGNSGTKAKHDAAGRLLGA